MQKGFPRYPGSREELRAENKIMKQKLMEKGAEFSEQPFPDDGNGEEVENIFLKNVLEYESQIAKSKKIRVFDRIGKPTHFKRAASIPDEKIEDAWKELLNYLNQYAIDLDACSPAITTRELYRFTIEELFYHKMDDVVIPGMITCFIYDEFHPDPVYDNTIAATDYCMRYVLEKEPLQWMHHFRDGNLWLNDQFFPTTNALKEKINEYKSRYDDLVIEELGSTDCMIDENKCMVRGVYSVKGITAFKTQQLSGRWRVHFEKSEEFGNWAIVKIDIEGISF